MGNGLLTDMICRTIEDNKNFDMAVVGQRGDGKSWAAMKLGEIVARHFNTPFSVDNIHFEASHFLEHVRALTEGKEPDDVLPGNVLILDEAGRGISSHEWWDSDVKAVTAELETYRLYRCFTIFTSPSITNIAKRARDMVSAYMTSLKPKVSERRDLIGPTSNIIKNRGLSRWRFYLLQEFRYKGRTDTLKYRPRGEEAVLDSVLVSKPDPVLLDAYDKKKRGFLESSRRKELDRMKVDDKPEKEVDVNKLVDEVLSNKDKYMTTYRGKSVVNKDLLKAEYGLSQDKTRMLKALCDQVLCGGRG